MTTIIKTFTETKSYLFTETEMFTYSETIRTLLSMFTSNNMLTLIDYKKPVTKETETKEPLSKGAIIGISIAVGICFALIICIILHYTKKNNIIELKLSSDNPEAIRIYQGQGFIHDELIMKREIKEDEVDE